MNAFDMNSYYHQSSGIYDDVQELPVLDCQATLLNTELWRRFCELGNEMIITKSGRCMFPVITVLVDGLEANCNYAMSIEMHQLEGGRWSRTKGHWCPNRVTTNTRINSEASSKASHPLSPAPAALWSRPFKFNNVKLTNNRYACNGNILLESMHKYLPVLRVSRLGANPAEKCFAFPEAEFVAVTAYQNNEIARLKIDFNPYARGFRDGERRKKNLKKRETIKGRTLAIPSLDCSHLPSSPSTFSSNESNSPSPPLEVSPVNFPSSQVPPSAMMMAMGTSNVYSGCVDPSKPEYWYSMLSEWSRNVMIREHFNAYLASSIPESSLCPPAPQWRPAPTWHIPYEKKTTQEIRPKGSSFTIRALLQNN